MQKKIIVLAIAAALTAPAAFADTSNVTVYGVADVSYDIVKTGTSAAAAGTSDNRVSSNTSRLGLKGSEDLGDGLSAIWQIESLINIGNGSGTSSSTGTGIGGRNTFAGLSSGSMGTVVLGHHDTPYKISTRKFDVFGDGIADNRSIMGGQSFATVGANAVGVTAVATNPGGFASAAASFDGRQDQVIAYISPKLGNMFTGAIAYVNLTPAHATAATQKNSALSLAGMFDIAGGFYGSLAYEAHDLNTVAVGAKEKATKLGLGYTQDAFTVGFAYEKNSDNAGALRALAAGADAFGHNAYYLSGKYNIGSDAVKAAYTKAGSLANSVNTGASQFSLGYDHSMSKRTTLYALYTRISNNTAGGYTLSNNSSIGGLSTSSGAGASPSAFAFGMKHTF